MRAHSVSDGGVALRSDDGITSLMLSRFALFRNT